MIKYDKDTFIIFASNHGKATDEGNSRKANDIHKKLMKGYSEINEENKTSLSSLIYHEETYVRLWASAFLLKYQENSDAIATLKSIALNNKISGLTAQTLLDMHKKGIL